MFTESELAYLEGSPIKKKILEQRKKHRDDYDFLTWVVDGFDDISFDEYLDAMSIVQTRAFGPFNDK